MMVELRRDLPPLPRRMRKLPLDDRGYPIPYFVSWIDGKPEFRIANKNKVQPAASFRRCWICGETLGSHGAFIIGPMCSVNRVSSEPPNHRDCAIFATQACPFLARPNAVRRRANLPVKEPPPGYMIERNPGVALVWVTKRWRTEPFDDGGVLFHLGDPTETLWFREGRAATRAEVIASIHEGLPALVELAEKDGPSGLRELQEKARAALAYLPPEGP